MQVNLLTHTATVTPNSKQLKQINILKQQHKAQDQRELFGLVGKTQQDVDNTKDATSEHAVGLKKQEEETGIDCLESEVEKNLCDMDIVEETVMVLRLRL